MAEVQETITATSDNTGIKQEPLVLQEEPYYFNKTKRTEEIQQEMLDDSKRVNKSLIVYSIVFLIISIAGVYILMKKGSSIWFYLLLFLIIAPFVSSASGMLVYQLKKRQETRDKQKATVA